MRGEDNKECIILSFWARASQSVQRLTTGLDGPGLETWGWVRFSAPVQTIPGTQPASYTMGTGSFPGVKWRERVVDHSPPPSAKVKERVGLYIYSSSGPSWPVVG